MKLFTKHPKEVDMTYIEHLMFALKLSALFFLLSIVSLTHAVFPFLFTKTASNLIKELHMELSEKRACGECCCCKTKECKCKHCDCCCEK